MDVQHTTLCLYVNRLSEDEPSGFKHADNIKKLKTKTLIYKMCILLVYTV
jgi:hypothetical protein